MKYKVVTADDHTFVSKGVEAILSTHTDYEIIASYSNGKEVIEHCKQNEVDIVILDINMPVMDGIKCAKILKRDFPKIKVLILTMYDRPQFISELMQIGIDGCVQKDKSGEDLLVALENITAEKKFVKTGFLNENQKSKDQTTNVNLSGRELEIIDLIVTGLSSKEVGEKLFISLHTVNTHRRNINKKLNVSDLNELMAKALELGLLK